MTSNPKHPQKIQRIKLGKEPVDNMLKVGASVMLLPMGDRLKFTFNGIKYTIIRGYEK